MIVWAAARCRDKLGDYQQKLGKNRPLRKDNKTESECNGIFHSVIHRIFTAWD
jgi:hypothetical protein